MKLHILGIMRDRKFSPNHVSNDAIIMRLTAEKLRALGYDLTLMSEAEFVKYENNYDAYISMGRNDETLKKLSELEMKGRVVVNSPSGVYNSFREILAEKLSQNGAPTPLSIVINTHEFDSAAVSDFPPGKLWLKRDNHTLHREDVTPIYSLPELIITIKEFKRRGIKKSVLQEHKVGSEIKFYGVRGTDFFSWYYVNGVTHNAFSEEELRSVADNASRFTDISVFGGDAIISETGEISIIDFNDWPSFAPVKDEASSAIARFVDMKIKGGEN